MNKANPDVVVLRKNTEGLSTRAYTEILQEKLPDYTVVHADTPKKERELIQNAPVATGVTMNTELLDCAENLELFAVASSGYNHLPMDELTEKGVVVSNAAGIHAPGIAEQALGYCLMFARQLHTGWQRNVNHEWRHYQPGELKGSTVTIVGLGAIGTEFVNRLEGMDVDTIGIRYSPEKGGPTDEVYGFDEDSIHSALARTDYLVLSTPLSETTRNLIDEAELNTLPPSAYVINVCRGGVIHTDALVAALQKNDISGAALDVTDPEPLPTDCPLWRMGNVLITPHVGGHTPKHWDRLSDIVVHNVEQLERGSKAEFHNRVNDPRTVPSPKVNED
ncbi:D-2-hydroxyacid dehydrogenase [Natronosalvus rutilus]|uniref:D-2-hydroxyacid dehydrogenase n=1 Tax=Natronosalvus rutilus TaxID=2953753 RepID=A0A9E7NES1_9EURY|nr:D-2-hydroxyacid dehydrogenase [Natronosalvus rutilus]UTF55718.1 D-2-hydroxyacid dehydrogenase [Natronosalvus rutilus]